MKKIITLLYLVSFFAACTDESPTPNNSNNSSGTSVGITGVWNLVDLIEEDGQITRNGELASTYSTTTSNQNGTTEFRTDGTYISKIGYDYQIINTVDGEASVDNANKAPVITLGEYTYDSNKKEISTTVDGATFTSLVTELAVNKIVIVTDTRTETVEDGVTIVSTNKTTATYSK